MSAFAPKADIRILPRFACLLRDLPDNNVLLDLRGSKINFEDAERRFQNFLETDDFNPDKVITLYTADGSRLRYIPDRAAEGIIND